MKLHLILFLLLVVLFVPPMFSVTCNSCSSCRIALNNNEYVELSSNLSASNSCILTNNLNNKILDCKNHSILGNKQGFGIRFKNAKNITILNCMISNFTTNLNMLNSKNIKLYNLTLYDAKYYGLYINDGNYSNISNIYVQNNLRRGIFIKNSHDCYVDNVNLINNNVSFQISTSYNFHISNLNISNNSNIGFRFYKINTSYVENIKVNNLFSGNYGVYISNSNSNIFNNISSLNNNRDGVYVYSSFNNTFSNFTVYSNKRNGVYFVKSTYNIFRHSHITNNTKYGLRTTSTSYNNSIFNNFFNNTHNVRLVSSIYLNISRIFEQNIVYGPIIGGNYWATPTNTGYSQTCMDKNLDGLCDDAYSISNNVDYLPLTEYTNTMYIFFNSPAPENASLTNGTNITLNLTLPYNLIKHVWFVWNGTKYNIFDDHTILLLNLENNTLDNSMYSHYTESSNATFIKGKHGNCILFNGLDTNITINNSIYLNPENITIEAWFKLDNMKDGMLVDKEGSYRLWFDNYGNNVWNNIVFEIWNGSNWNQLVITREWELDKWYFVVATFDGHSMKIYLNGKKIGEKEFNYTIPYSDENLLIGTYKYDHLSYTFNGSIDEIKLYNYPLNESEVLFHYKLYYNRTELLKNFDQLLDGTYTYYGKIKNNEHVNYTYDNGVEYNNSNQRYLYVDTTPPKISFVYPTPLNNSMVRELTINVSANDSHLNKITLYVFNNTSVVDTYTCNNTTVCYHVFSLNEGVYYVNATALDILNNRNFTETRTIYLNKTIDFHLNVEPSCKEAFVNITSDIPINVSFCYEDICMNDTNYSTSHLLHLSDLKMARIYNYNLTLCDKLNNCLLNFSSFRTLNCESKKKKRLDPLITTSCNKVSIYVEYKHKPVEHIRVVIEHGLFMKVDYTNEEGKLEFNKLEEGEYKISLKGRKYKPYESTVLVKCNKINENQSNSSIILNDKNIDRNQNLEQETIKNITHNATQDNKTDIRETVVVKPPIQNNNNVKHKFEENNNVQSNNDSKPIENKCSQFLNLCWYWWLALIVVVSFTIYYLNLSFHNTNNAHRRKH